MLNRYNISDTDTEFVITKNPTRAKTNFYISVLILVIWYAVLINNHKSDVSSLIYLFYLLPLLVIPRIFKYLKGGISPIKIIFSKKQKTIKVPYHKEVDFGDVQKVVIDYPNTFDTQECTLNLILSDGKRIEIDKTDASLNSEVIQAGKSISRLLGVPIEDKHPYEEKL
ncbi:MULTISPECIES: hypothetical protein [Roseivirga]|uniref:Uncharacterized protein n=1 Tax=Roseivirga spongicola TaxID=333140 RepID=A0A150XBK5_9BACT|nr:MULTISPECIES: hypothetical protein [Roseivirga]KYG76076.1 hypothetical protein AWW68_09670 [Roseivirga spongicola]MBO6659265.1 hypothetical protein [Roseivirga sp.]MBO6760401.1 hypothetical protein [Roseivirga sp.]MBO6907998.1 hypothetical protein [Roseivirga sp.]WPZ10347.1 hypothetical protein T7867_18970 [Roseivirga spongicola]